MRDGRRSVLLVLAGAALAVGGCSATKTGPGPSAGASIAAEGAARSKFSGLSFQAELAPISALAWEAPHLWMGSDRGLRRVRVSDENVEWISLGRKPSGASAASAGGAGGTSSAASAPSPISEADGAGPRVTALAPAAGGGVWVGTDSGLGRVSNVGEKPTFQLVASLPGVTHLAACAAEAPGGPETVWLGTSHGLFVARGATVRPIATAGNAAITFLQAAPEEQAPPEAGGRQGRVVRRAGHDEASAADRCAVWIGAHGRGLLLVAGDRVVRQVGPGATPSLDFQDPVGVSVLSNGTPFAIGRSRDGATKLIKLHPAGAEPLETEPVMKVWGVVTTSEGPLAFVSQADGAATAVTRGTVFRLEPIERGERLPPGAFRFVQGRGNLQGLRVAALPDRRALPPEMTAWISTDQGVFVGTRAAGAARLADVGGARAADAKEVPAPASLPVVPPTYLAVGEVIAHASALSVACIERDRCVIATGAGPGWIWDGQRSVFRPVPVEALGGPLMALGGDGEGAVYFMAGDGPKGIKVARLSADGARWEPVLTVQVTTEGAPVVSAATVSPTGNLWMSIRSRADTGEESGRGVIEVQLPSGKSIHHHAARAGEPRSPAAIPLAGDVRAVRFQTGTSGTPDAIWFCTSLGVIRSTTGEEKLARWSENDGLASDSCHDLAILADGSVWAATSRGAARFDGKTWTPFDGRPSSPGGEPRWPRPRHRPTRDGEPDEEDDVELLGARALVSAGGALWAGTPRGVWSLTSAGRPFDERAGLLDEDVRDLVLDRFGRLWVMGHLGLTVTDKFP